MRSSGSLFFSFGFLISKFMGLTAAPFFLFVRKESNSYLILCFSRRFPTAMIQVRNRPIPEALWISGHGIFWCHPVSHKSGRS
jgi:hypothetical protein